MNLGRRPGRMPTLVYFFWIYLTFVFLLGAYFLIDHKQSQLDDIFREGFTTKKLKETKLNDSIFTFILEHSRKEIIKKSILEFQLSLCI